MVKTRNGLISLVVALVMVAALLIPMVGPASAACTYSMTFTQSITPGAGASVTSQIGNLEVTFDVPTFVSANGAKMVYLSLPENPGGYQLYVDDTTVVNTVYNLASQLNVSPGSAEFTALTKALTVSNNTTWTGGTSAPVLTTVAGADPTTSYIEFNGNAVFGGNNPLYTVPNGATSVSLTFGLIITIPSGTAGGPVVLNASAQSTSPFSSGQITIANVKVPSVTLSAESSPAISSSGQAFGTIDFKENTTGALQTADNSPSLSLTLPAGITWASLTAEAMWGGSYNLTSSTGGSVSYFTALTSPAANYTYNGASCYVGYTTTANNGTELDFYSQNVGSKSGYFIKFNGTVNIDASTAAAGPISVTIGGETQSTVSTVTVGNYGSYGATPNAPSTIPTIIAGKAASSVAELEIKESAPGSILPTRNITLTLPSDVMWAEAPSVDPALTTNLGGLTGLNGYSTTSGWSAVGTTGNEIQATIGGTATTGNAADIFLKNIEVTPAVDFTGPVTVTIGGTEGLTGTATLANVAAGITAAAASTPTVQLGQATQTLGDLTITEAAAGNIGATETDSYLNTTQGSQNEYLAPHIITSNQAEIDIYAPAGVTFYATPAVTVTSGNLQLGTVSTTTNSDNQGELVIPIMNASRSASMITIAAPQVTINNIAPNGPIIFKVKGTAVDQTEMPATLPANTTGQQLFPNDTTAASVTVADLGTAGTTGPSGTVVFTIGQASYTMNGAPVSTDVAPYIKDSRTFVPLRAVANALGVPDSGIIWDPNSYKVTIIKGSLVAQFTIGSDKMLLNGATVMMDTSPEITDGRTCLPIAWAAQALGVTYTWDGTAQTVTFGTPATAPAAGLPSAPSGGAATTNPTTATTTNPTTTP